MKKLEVHLHSNYSCNLHCNHCYNYSDIHKNIELPAEFMVTLIKNLCEQYESEIHLEGGEIFLKPEFLTMLNDLPNEVLKCITITTNGTICLKDEIILSMLRKISSLRVSVEGHTNEQQRAIRGIDIDNVLKNARYYMENNIPVWLRITLNRLNQEGFVNNTLPVLYEKGFNKIQVYEFQKVGRGGENGKELALQGSVSGVLDDLFNYRDSLTGELKIMFSKRRLAEVKEYEQKLTEKQFSVRYLEVENGISIHADGEIFLCAWDNDASHSLGNVLKMDREDFFDLLSRTNLKHNCEYCSAICVTKKGDGLC